MAPILDALPVVPSSSAEALYQYQTAFRESVAGGVYRPYAWPYSAAGPYLLIAYLLLPPTRSGLVFALRYPLFILIIYLSVEATLECRSLWPSFSYVIGLLNAWAILWSATLLIFHDARSEFRRIEGREKYHVQPSETQEPARDAKTTAMQDQNQVLKKRETSLSTSNGKPKEGTDSPAQDIWVPRSTGQSRFVWQGLPQDFLHRVDWVLDVGSSFRGPRWNYAISAAPSPPRRVQDLLRDPSLTAPNAESEMTRRDLLHRFLPQFVMCVLALDALKTVAMDDGYFWSLPASSPSPFPWPKASRTLLSVILTYLTLNIIMLLSPLVYGVLLSPRWIGEHGWPWLFPPYFGPVSAIGRRGLAGAWGQWWQQVFRFAFERAGEVVASQFGWDKKTQKGMMLRVTAAFVLSAVLHTCGSYTSVNATRPWKAFAFFAIQPVGIFAQTAAVAWLKQRGYRERIPVLLRRFGNIIVVVIWFYFTGPLIADDFAACGIWLLEPLPVSIGRGLKGDGWWRWGGSWVYWHSDKDWWKSGLAI